jgi:hypothetical protein
MQLTGKLHAYFLSQLGKLVHSCKVAMSGIISENEAKETLKQCKSTGEILNVYKYIDLLGTLNVDSNKYLFTYVVNITKDENSDRTKNARAAHEDGEHAQFGQYFAKGSVCWVGLEYETMRSEASPPCTIRVRASKAAPTRMLTPFLSPAALDRLVLSVSNLL